MQNPLREITENIARRKPEHLWDVPTPLSAIIGREEEIARLCTLLALPEVRLVTLLGPGGVGKTRLSIEVAMHVGAAFADGVYFVELTPIRDPAQVLLAIAQALRIPEVETQVPLRLVAAALHEKHILLLIDNFEQVLEAAEDLAALLKTCPYIKMLVTSRTTLRIQGEQEFQVQPLAFPAPDHLPEYTALPDYAAIALFLQRVRAQIADFQLTQANAQAIATICAHLDGLPLAIELAAARVKLLPPQALLARLSRRLQLLTGGARTLPERQQTLRSTLKWSYDLLGAHEQQLFRRIAVFVRGCSLEAAESLYLMLGNDTEQVLDGVTTLIDNSLLQQIERDGSEPRLLMLETIREYGLECLHKSEEAETLQYRHATYFLALAEKIEPELEGPQQAVWMERLDLEYDNLRAALQWAIAESTGTYEQERRQTALRLTVALRRFWLVRGYLSEGQDFLERALALNTGMETPLYGKAQLALSILLCLQGNYSRVEALCSECLELFRKHGDARYIASVLYQLGRVAWLKGDLQKARLLAEDALIYARKSGHQGSIAWALFRLARLIIEQGEYARGRAILEESLALHKKIGNKRAIASSLYHLAWVHLISESDLSKVRSLITQAQTIFVEVGDREGMAYSLGLAGQLAYLESDYTSAVVQLQESERLFRKMRHREGIAWILSLRGKVAMGQADYEAAKGFYHESLEMALELDNKGLLASCLEGLAAMLTTRAIQRENKGAENAAGQFMVDSDAFVNLRWAVQCWGAAEALRDTAGLPIVPIDQDQYKRLSGIVREQLGEATFSQEWARGRVAAPRQVMHAPDLAGPPIPAPVVTPARSAQMPLPDGLTARELEVLQLIAQGLTSTQMAERLILSPLTVNSHVRSIYNKLSVTSRSGATSYAIKHGLV